MSPTDPDDPFGMRRGRTLNGVMDGLMDLAEGPVRDAFRDALGSPLDVQVTRYRQLQPNPPAIWHERRPGRIVEVDNAHERTELFLAVIFALSHGDGQAEGLALEHAIDATQTIYRHELVKRDALNWVHQARLVNLEPPTPTVIDSVPLLTAGLVVRVRIDAPYR